MKITSVVVEIHEKRPHPTAMGHFDSRVAYTAELHEGDDPDKVIGELQTDAREFVIGECDRWVEEIKLEEKRSNARSHLRFMVDRADKHRWTDLHANDFGEHLTILPAEEHAELRAELATAQLAYWPYVRKGLDEDISAASKGLLSEHGKIRFEEDLEHLPEGERDAFRQRMADAVAPKMESTPVAGADNDNDLTNKVPDDDRDDGWAYAGEDEFDDGEGDEEIPL